jgi:hypothetical protein
MAAPEQEQRPGVGRLYLTGGILQGDPGHTMVAKRALKSTLEDRVRTLAVHHRYPPEWIAEKLEMEGYPRTNGRWSADRVRRFGVEHGIAFFPYKEDSLISARRAASGAGAEAGAGGAVAVRR